METYQSHQTNSYRYKTTSVTSVYSHLILTLSTIFHPSPFLLYSQHLSGHPIVIMNACTTKGSSALSHTQQGPNLEYHGIANRVLIATEDWQVPWRPIYRHQGLGNETQIPNHTQNCVSAGSHVKALGRMTQPEIMHRRRK